MDSEIICTLIGAGVTVSNVLFTTLVNKHSEKKRQAEVEELKQSDKIRLLETGLQALLRAEIIRQHDKYMDKGYCSIYARDALDRVYESYHALGGNGTMTDLYKQTTALPTEPEEANNG